jgi:hypothetical protein
MAEAQATTPERRGIARLLWGMAVRPRVTLEYLNENEKRAWWLPALLGLLLAVLPILVAAPITTRQSREAFLANQEQIAERYGTQQDPAQMEQALSIATNPLITTIFPAVVGGLGRIAGWLIWAGVLYLAGMALGGRSTYGALFRMVVWAWLPYTVRGLLQTVYIVASGQLITNPGLSGLVKQPQSVSELFTAPPSLGQTLCAAGLGVIDLYLVWNLILLVIGVSVTTRLPKRKAVLVTLGVWILLTAVSLIPTLVGSLAMQGLSM